MDSGPFVDDLLIEHLNLPEFFRLPESVKHVDG